MITPANLKAAEAFVAGSPITPITYPLRPVDGGVLTPEVVREGWVYQPKYNGWRALIHTPTGTMFNRKGEPLSIAAEFAVALEQLRSQPYEWLDCEALERRHKIGRGSLIVLDAVAPVSLASHTARRARLGDYLRVLPIDPGEMLENNAYLTHQLPAEVDAMILWRELQEANQRAGCDFYEGVVAKHPGKTYPTQLRSPDQTFPYWVKHRWPW